MHNGNIDQLFDHARRCDSMGNLNGAVQAYQQVIQRDPRNGMALHYLGNCYKLMGRHHDAKRTLERALDVGYDTVDVTSDYASLLHVEGDYDKALEIFSDLHRRDPTSARVIHDMVELLATMNRYDEALDILRPHIKAQIKDARIAMALSRICHRVGLLKKSISAIQYQLDDIRLTATARMAMLYRLSELHEKAENFDESFKAASMANEIKQVQYDPESHARSIDLLIERWSSDRLDTIPTSDCTSNRPVFIVGMPRSGTTLVEQMLSMLPDCYGAGERPYITYIIQHLGGDAVRTDVPHMHRTGMLTKGILDQAAQGYLSMMQAVHDQTSRITDKRPDNFLHLGLISRLFPNAHVIHTVRNVEDVAISCYCKNFYGQSPWSYALDHIAGYIADYARLLNHWKQTLDLPILDVVYEDLVSDTQPIAREMVEFIGLPWDDEILNFHTSTRIAKTASVDQVRSPIYQSSVNRAKHYQAHLKPFHQAMERARMREASLSSTDKQ